MPLQLSAGSAPASRQVPPSEAPPMRILLWHGYLLGGTGSNVYTRALAREWARAGHDVVVFTQEPHAGRFDLGGAAVVRPDIGGLLPVFVLDRYEGLEAKLVQDLTPGERDRYVDANAGALREHLPADLVFANHVVMGGPVAAASGARYAVKAHGSELEYSLRDRPELAAWGREALAAFETGNADVLREKLRRLLALPRAERSELAAAARRAAVERWSWAGVARRLLEPVL